MAAMHWLKRKWWRVRSSVISGVQVVALLKDPSFWRSYYPEAPRKTKLMAGLDLLYWTIRYREFNRGYFLRGLDRVHAPAAVRLSEKRFRRTRDQRNSNPQSVSPFYEGKYNYLSLTRDKFLFGQYLTSLDLPTPENLAVLTRHSVAWADGSGSAPLMALVERYEDLDGFCKPVDGILGQKAFAVAIRSGNLKIDADSASVSELGERLDGRYLLQRAIVQHPDMSALHPGSVNTLRVVSVRTRSGDIEVLSATLKSGVHGGRTDNPASGGLAIAVDIESGRAVGDGFFKPGKGWRVSTHPDTNVRFDGFQIPNFVKALSLAMQAHRYFYGLHSIGWDLAFSSEGPLIIEGNDDWGMPIFLTDRFRDRFRDLFEDSR
ncbi:sugar-transfer associated ATP-grasp domain-containing protein [Lentisalinibacter salinarum]|uniref:sugar-transfer associated ATP-grasp domain-containing protein n=1 Tax=Lentisalinibacter salinarum TaxID=2992239 RepID=UPI00386C7EB7